jgi:predicted O-linked N-acetylglucosamine transferase (SPINDLY family)
MSAAVIRKLQQAEQQLKHGDIDGAALSCEEVLRRAPRNPEALWLLGIARLMSQRVDEAIAHFERVLAALPNHGAALENLGLAHLMRGDYATAERQLRKAAAHPSAPASVFMRLGLALLHQGNSAEAVTQLEHARNLQPANLDVHASLGRAYAAQSRWGDALREFEHVQAGAPNDPDTLYNLGVVSAEEGAPDAALSWFDQCLARAPQHLDALERRAMLYLALGRFRQAAEDLRIVVAARPADASALLALAEAGFQCGALDEAFETAAKARDLDPAASGPYSLMAQMHHVQGALDKAVDVLEEGYARTRADALLGALVHLTHRQCDWRRWKPAWHDMASRLDYATDLGSPFWLLQENTTPAQQLSYTRRWVAHSYPTSASASREMERQRKGADERWRIGYYSGDFHQHPVACLVVEALELHDRERFEIFAYSYGPDDGSELRSRLVNAVEHFVDVAWEPNDVVLNRIRCDRLHLLIDLKGYTAGDRLRVMAERPCAVQAAWLGYPATTGAPFIDYLIADDYIVSPEMEQHYSERVLRLPNSYQANDRKRRAAPPRARADYGLPEDAFVFCCFNQTVKITPDIFGRWMSLLRRVDGSVLWLLDDNRWATGNLREVAEQAGIAVERVVIGPRLPPAEHLARYRAADLALDTFPYTSHTTGSDALWLGCPFVALSGDTFASRVSGSLLVNCGLPELITRTPDEYEALAVRLANDVSYMQEVKARLAVARDSAPLFDSQRFVCDLENLYLQIVS